MISVSKTLRNLATLALAVVLTCTPLAAGDGHLDQAVLLYDAGRYAEALPLLEQTVAGGSIDGVTHYRLYFCRRNVGTGDHRAALESARTLLEAEVKTADGLEAAFYLANTYTNLGLPDEVSRLSAEVTARVESGEIPAPEAAIEQFRLGKLYVDQGRDIDAQPWLTRAVDGFAAAGEARHAPYLEWAARWLGQRAFGEERFEAAARQFGHIHAAGKASLSDLDKLGMASLMIGNYDTAGKAFRAAARMKPADADGYRYGAGLAQLAGKVQELPISPDGERSWDEVGREELETLLRESAQKVRETRAEIAATEKMTPAQRKEFSARLIEPRPMFTAAALEYRRRGLSLREAAFFGGYAPLIFKSREWELSAPTRKPMTPREVAAERERLMKARAAKESAAGEQIGDEKKD
jgi:tetratricopeptide (TPR) repeat protein